MARGGYRAGSGRPNGSKDSKPRARRLTKDAPAELDPNGGDETGISYLLRILNDTTAVVQRRDRAAALLAAIEARSLDLAPLGKKAQAEVEAKTAAIGTRWADVVH